MTDYNLWYGYTVIALRINEKKIEANLVTYLQRPPQN